MSTEKNAILDAVLKTHNIELDEAKIKAYRSQRDKIKERLEAFYGSKAYSPLNSGSYAKKTAININYDLDLALPFKYSAFTTLQEMFQDVLYKTKGLIADASLGITSVEKQRRSVNVLFNVNGETLDMDIVPGRELGHGRYDQDHKLNLYDSKLESSIQTNIHTHTELLLGRNLERDVVKLLKVWKTSKNEDMKSFLVELMVLEAFDKDSTLANEKLYGRLKGSLAFIVDNISTKRFVDPANSANIVSDTLEPHQKEQFKGKLARILDDIERDEAKLIQYFPANPNHMGILDPMVKPKFQSRPNYGNTNSFA